MQTLDPPLIEARSVSMAYATCAPILTDLDFQIRAGEFVSLVGPSGCGKSTLLRLIAGLLVPSSGRLTVGGAAASDQAANGPQTGFVFQDPTLLPWRDVLANIRLPLELRRQWHPGRQDDIHELLELIGLTPDDARKRPRMLSGGMRMRVSLARALVTQPDLLLLDEPFAALDDLLRQSLNVDLQRIWRARGCCAVFVTHNVAEAVFLSQRILVMDSNPGTITAEIAIPFRYPRAPEIRASPEFAALNGQVSQALRRDR
ncbi:MAG: ABC transporter ATP-binding protein [Planctomycetaceae bacterium]